MWSELVLSKCSGRNTVALGEHSGALLRFRDGRVTTREIARALILPRTLPSGIARLAGTRAHNGDLHPWRARELSHGGPGRPIIDRQIICRCRGY